jgi:hypothetical protein
MANPNPAVAPATPTRPPERAETSPKCAPGAGASSVEHGARQRRPIGEIEMFGVSFDQTPRVLHSLETSERNEE